MWKVPQKYHIRINSKSPHTGVTNCGGIEVLEVLRRATNYELSMHKHKTHTTTITSNLK
jgi:hypothetical protein